MPGTVLGMLFRCSCSVLPLLTGWGNYNLCFTDVENGAQISETVTLFEPLMSEIAAIFYCYCH